MFFGVYNYLRKPISVYAVLGQKGNERLVDVTRGVVHPGKNKMLDLGFMGMIFRDGVTVKVCTHELIDHNRRSFYHEPSESLYGVYKLSLPEERALKAFHVGMITSRWISMSSAYRTAQNGLNNVQGMPWVLIHNHGPTTLRLNTNIVIPSGGTVRYKGRDHFGVRLGTVFKDIDGLYPDLIWTVPSTDIYYGVVSDLQQSIFGGYQETHGLKHDSDGIIFPLRQGWQGGPAKPGIPFGYIPQYGDSASDERPVDRWGQPVTAKGVLAKPIGSPPSVYI